MLNPPCLVHSSLGVHPLDYVLVDDISFYFNFADYPSSIDAVVLCVLLTYQIR